MVVLYIGLLIIPSACCYIVNFYNNELSSCIQTQIIN